MVIVNIFSDDDVKTGTAYAGVYDMNHIFSIQYGALQNPHGIKYQFFNKENIQRYPSM